jgi:hypothetical protein
MRTRISSVPVALVDFVCISSRTSNSEVIKIHRRPKKIPVPSADKTVDTAVFNMALLVRFPCNAPFTDRQYFGNSKELPANTTLWLTIG